MEDFAEKTPKLGFGYMRLPKRKDGSEDIEQIKKMVDVFMGAGLTYFDTAYVYDDGESEKALKASLVDRYPRDSFTVCSKLNARVAKNEEEAKKQFSTSMERIGIQYFDYYLLHALMESNYKKYDEYHLWDFVKEQKEKGLIRHYGFSFHATPELLDQLLTEHPDVDYVQLQCNYADWDNPSVQSRRCFEVARKHHKPVTVMEPVKGGTLARLPEEAEKIMKEERPDMSIASWGIRWMASKEGILTVLSGMSSLEQVEDNVSYMKDFQKMSEKEEKVIEEVQKILARQDVIECTACHYCTEGCPQGIPIPDVLAAMNIEKRFHNHESAQNEYAFATRGKGKAEDCVHCRQCEGACPQHLPITDLLEEAAKLYE